MLGKNTGWFTPDINQTGWWLSPTPLENDGVKVSWDDYSIPNVWKIIQMFQTTNQQKLQTILSTTSTTGTLPQSKLLSARDEHSLAQATESLEMWYFCVPSESI